MNRPGSYRRRICLAALLTLLAGILSACALNRNADIAALTGQTEEDASGQNDSALSGYLGTALETIFFRPLNLGFAAILTAS